ncbi:MAG: DUF4276 family protein [Akkermansia sp.]
MSITERLQIRSNCLFLSFNGKSDLEKKILPRMRGWKCSNACFLVMRDRDSAQCMEIKESLVDKCRQSGVPDTHFRVRIACGELESFYLGDFSAIAQAYENPSLQRKSSLSKYRNPDNLGNPCEEFFKLVGEPQAKIRAAQLLGQHINLDNYENNRSLSFRCLMRTLLNFKRHQAFSPSPIN